jgi:cytochrome P450
MSTAVAGAPTSPAARPAPPTPRGTRLIHGLAMLYAEHRLIEHCQRRYGDVFALKLLPPFESLVVVADPGEVKRIFTGDPELLHAGEGNAVLEPIVGLNSVLLLDESAHLHQRKLMLPPFHGDRMRLYGDLMREVTEQEVAGWPVDEPFPLHPSMQAITLRVIMRAVFGIEDAGRLAQLEPLLQRMVELGQRVIMVQQMQRDLGPRSPWGRFLRVRAAADDVMAEVIRERRAATDLDERSDVLSLLMQARDPDGAAMTARELRDELVTLLVAGHETTATQLAWTFERLLRHPAAQDRLQKKLADGSDGYLDCVLKESQRSRPVLDYAMRRLTAPMEVGGYTVPAGATLGASVWLLHHNPDLYPDPAAFRPERWEERPADTYSWIPFGGGVRRCLGAAFATYEMKVVMRTVLERCELAAAEAAPERQKRRIITFVPGKGARAVLRSRRA